MHWTAGFRLGCMSDITGPPPVMCAVRLGHGDLTNIATRCLIKRVSESANISESESSAQCPVCKKLLVTRSARLCVFCGEKLPENLLLPVSEVQREEQRSLDTVKRVIGAYEKRDAEIAERASHLTHSGALFGKQFKRIDEQLGEMLFPDVGCEKWVLHEFRRTLKLPDDDFDARRHKRELDERIRKLASRLATAFGRLECDIRADHGGHLSARLTDKALSLEMETQFGRNATFAAGVPQSFCSYAIRVEARVLALNKADAAARRFRIACMIAGILGVPAAFVWFSYTIASALGLEIFHRLWLNEIGIALAFLFGAWVGAKAGQVLAALIEKRTFRRAEAEGALPKAESLWKALTQGIEDITREYEVV